MNCLLSDPLVTQPFEAWNPESTEEEGWTDKAPKHVLERAFGEIVEWDKKLDTILVLNRHAVTNKIVSRSSCLLCLQLTDRECVAGVREMGFLFEPDN